MSGRKRVGRLLSSLGLAGSSGAAVEDGPLLPAFECTDHSGEPRGPADLLGTPTVLWFYPMASTAG